MSTVKQWILVVKQNWHFPREKLYKAAHLQTLHTSPAPAGWIEISGYTLHSLLFHWFTSSYETFLNIDSILNLWAMKVQRQYLSSLSWQDCFRRDTLMTGLLKIIIVFSCNQMPPSIPSQIPRIKQCSGIVWSKVQPSFETGFENVKVFNRKTQSS